MGEALIDIFSFLFVVGIIGLLIRREAKKHEKYMNSLTDEEKSKIEKL